MAVNIVPKWECFEIEFFVAKKMDNPFLDVDFSALFTADGREYQIDGFYDGDSGGRHTFIIRFAPMYEGVWEWKTVSNIEELNGKNGGFECVTPVSRGPLAADIRFPNWFFRADGKPEFIINDGWYPHPLFEFALEHENMDFGSPSEDDMRLFISELSKYGVNMILECDQLYARQNTPPEPSFNWPWQPAAGNNPFGVDRDRFNLEYFRRMERIIRFAMEKDIFYSVELMFDNSTFRPLEWSHHPLNAINGGWLKGNGLGTCWPEVAGLNNKINIEYTGRFLRYIVARLSAFRNVLWSLGSESGNLSRPPYDGQIIEWYTHWGDYIARKDPHGRPQSIGDTGELAGLIQNRRNNFIITQEHTSMKDEQVLTDAVNKFGERFWQYGRPAVIGEQDRHNCGYFEAERKGYWAALVSGFHMGRVDRHFKPVENGKTYESVLFCEGETPPIYRYLKIMSDFIKESQIKYWRMSPNDSLMFDASDMVYCLAEPGAEYLVYFASGGAATLELPKCRWRWFNPRTGEFGEERIADGAGIIKFVSPDTDDMVLHIIIV